MMAKSRPKPPGKGHPVMVIMIGHAKPAPRKGAKGGKRK